MFYFRGSKLATSSGDTTVKVWDFSKAECVHTFTDHTHAGRLTTLTVYCELIFICKYKFSWFSQSPSMVKFNF